VAQLTLDRIREVIHEGTGLIVDYARDNDGQIILYTGLVENEKTGFLEPWKNPDEQQWKCHNCGNEGKELPYRSEISVRADGSHICPDCGSTEIEPVK